MATAQEFIDLIINNAIETANKNTTAVDEAAQNLTSIAGGYYFVPPDSTDKFAVSAIEPEIPDVDALTFQYEAQLDKLIKLLSDQLAGFFSKYYPLANDAFDEATAWMIDVITGGGTGINATIEAQLWQRNRDRILAETTSKRAQITAGYAAKGYFLPAGAMLKKQEEMDYAALAANGVNSTEVAKIQFDREIDTVKFAVDQAIRSRTMAMQAAAEYIRAVATAPASAIRAAEFTYDAKAKMMAAAATWYEARLDRDKIILNSKLAEMNSRDDIYKAQKTFAIQGDQVKASALTAAADAYARTAMAALSSLNSIVSSGINATA